MAKTDFSKRTDNVLPVSSLRYPGDPARHADFDPEAGGALQEFRKEVLISSPFVALSGDAVINDEPCCLTLSTGNS